MKICVITQTFPRDDHDATAAFMKEFCDGLSQNGHKVFLLTPFDQKFNREKDPFEIITYRYIWPDKLHLLGYSRSMEADQALRMRSFILIPFMVLFGTIALIKIIRQEGIDIINAHWIVPNGFMAMIASLVTRVPYTVTLPGTDAYLAFRYKIIGQIVKLIAKNSSVIFSNSSFHLKRIINLGVKPKLKLVIAYPIDTKKFKPMKLSLDDIKEKYDITKNDIIILAVGRMVYKKGYDYLIRALKLLKKKQIKLLLAGEGDLKDEWIRLTKNLKLENKVIFIGNIRRDIIVKYYNMADICVAPSIVDKLGNVDGGPVTNFEAMACGTPQIVTNVLGIADVLKNGVNGFIIPQKNIKALANAIDKLSNSQTLRQNMGKANVLLIRSNFSTKAVGRIYSEYFSKVISS